MNYETIIYEKKDNIGVITFNRPERKNALSVKLLREIPQAAAEAENDDEVVVYRVPGYYRSRTEALLGAINRLARVVAK